MATGKVTITSLAKLSGWLWDDRVVGFGARRQTQGVFYYVRYRHNGAQIIKSIGRHGALTPDTARNEAKRLLGVVAGGADPFAKVLAAEGFAPEIERYLQRKHAVLKPRGYDDVARYLRKHAAPLHQLALAEINRKTIAVLLGQIESGSGPVARNRLRSALSGFFSWCVAEGLLEINPVTGTAKAAESGGRERVLRPEELKALLRVLPEINEGFADVLGLLLLTGQRRNEIGKLTWTEFDAKRSLIVLAPARTKNGRLHELPLSRQALAILQAQPRRNSTEFVFANRGFTDWDKGKARLDRKLAIAPWTLHDLRRTAATGMAELGVQPHIIEAVLNHVSGHKGGVAGIYNRARYEGEMRGALQRWADHVEAITQ